MGAARWNLRLGRILFGLLHRRRGPDLRVVVSAGAKLDPELLRKLQGLGWQVPSGYGLAETASLFTGKLPARPRNGRGGQVPRSGRMRSSDTVDEGTGAVQRSGRAWGEERDGQDV